MSLEEYGIKLRQELMKNGSIENIKRIAEKINDATINGKHLTDNQISRLLKYITYGCTNDGKIIVKESDNSCWLDIIRILNTLLNRSEE